MGREAVRREQRREWMRGGVDRVWPVWCPLMPALPLRWLTIFEDLAVVERQHKDGGRGLRHPLTTMRKGRGSGGRADTREGGGRRQLRAEGGKDWRGSGPMIGMVVGHGSSWASVERHTGHSRHIAHPL